MALEEDKNLPSSEDSEKQEGFIEFETDEGQSTEGFSAYMPTPEKYLQEQQALKDVHQAKEYEEILPRSNSVEKILKVPDDKTQKKPLLEPLSEAPSPNNEKLQPEPPASQKVEEQVSSEPLAQSENPEENTIDADNLETQEVQYADLLPESDSTYTTIMDCDPGKCFEDQPALAAKIQKQEKATKTPKESQPEISNYSTSEKEAIIDDFKDDDIKTFCAVCHLSNVVLFTAFWVPFLMFFTKRNDPFVKFHAAQSIIYSFFFLLIGLVVILISSIMFVGIPCGCIICLSLPVSLAILGIIWGYAIYIVVQIYKGINFQIPYIADAANRIIEIIDI